MTVEKKSLAIAKAKSFEKLVEPSPKLRKGKYWQYLEYDDNTFVQRATYDEVIENHRDCEKRKCGTVLELYCRVNKYRGAAGDGDEAKNRALQAYAQAK